MKKITLLATLILATLTLHAQKVYDFTGSANPGTWFKAGSGISATPSAAGLILEFNSGIPQIKITRAADPFDVSVGTHMVVTLINNSTEVGSFSGFYDKNSTGSGTQYLGNQTSMAQATSPGSGVEETYIYKLTSAEYLNDPGNMTGHDTNSIADMEYIGIRFRDASASNLSGTSAANGNIILKKIVIADEGDLSKIDYNFATDNISGFEGLSGGTVSNSGTTLDFAGDNTTTVPKFAQTFYAVDASASQYVHIVVDNNASNADQIKVQFVDGTGAIQTYGNKTLNTGLSTTLDINLSGKTQWTGNISEWRFIFSESGGAAVNTNLIQISKIQFDNSSTLSTRDSNKVDFAMYPNPANNVVNLKSALGISKVTVFDITGKQVLSTSKLSNNALNVSTLKSGFYVLQLEDANQSKGVKKLVIK